jgi:hypothetical protein
MVRYKPSQFTKKELELMVAALALDSGIDFLTGGRLNKYKRKAAIAVYKSIVRPVATRAAIPAVASVARAGFGASRLVMTNPYVLGATAIYVGYQERERIKQLLDQGYEIVREEVVDPVLQQTAPGRQQLLEGMGPRPAPFIPAEIEQFRPKRKPSPFNKAIKAGMAAVKKSTSYGGIGKISPANKAFSVVVKLASAKKKKKKAPKSGIRRKIWTAMKRYI